MLFNSWLVYSHSSIHTEGAKMVNMKMCQLVSMVGSEIPWNILPEPRGQSPSPPWPRRAFQTPPWPSSDPIFPQQPCTETGSAQLSHAQPFLSGPSVPSSSREFPCYHSCSLSLSLSLSLPLSGEEDVGTSCGRIGGGAKSKRWQTFYMQLPHWFSRAIAHTRLALVRLTEVIVAGGENFSWHALCFCLSLCVCMCVCVCVFLFVTVCVCGLLLGLLWFLVCVLAGVFCLLSVCVCGNH